MNKILFTQHGFKVHRVKIRNHDLVAGSFQNSDRRIFQGTAK